MKAKQFLPKLAILPVAIALFFWWRTSGIFLLSGTLSIKLLVLGRLFGLLAVLSALFQFLLMGRVKWIEGIYGMDKLAKLHRTNGKYVLTFIVFHALFIVWSYSLTTKLTFINQIIDFWNHYSDVWQSIIAFCLFVIIALLSIYFSKIKIKYELWYFIHLFTYAAIVLSFNHQMKLGGDFFQQGFVFYWWALYIFVFANVAYFRFFRPVYFLIKHQFFVSKLVRETDEATSIYIGGKNLETFPRKAGQFMILRFLDIRRFWQAHPFSLSWGPENPELRVSVKDSGDFTHEISGLKKGTLVLIDGPHGGFTLKNSNSKKLLFIAGGIGITPIRSLIEESAPNYDIALLYSNKLSSDIALKSEIDTLSKKFSFPVVYFLTEESNPPSWAKKGRIDASSIGEIKDISEREVFLCGPLPFMLAIKDALISLGVSAEKIHFEEFSLH